MPDGVGSGKFWSLSVLSFALLRTADMERLRVLKQQVDQHLIPWRLSLKHELAAREVWCLTPNLRWARSHVPQILQSLRSDEKRKFRYIVFDNNSLKNSERTLEYAEYIIDEAAKDLEIAGRDGVEILFLTRDGTSCIWRPSDWPNRHEVKPSHCAYLPIPTDIAVYVDTPTDPENLKSKKRTFAVMSVVPVDQALPAFLVDAVSTQDRDDFGLGTIAGAAEQLYDIQLQRSEHYDPIMVWFSTEWDTRTAGH